LNLRLLRPKLYDPAKSSLESPRRTQHPGRARVEFAYSCKEPDANRFLRSGFVCARSMRFFTCYSILNQLDCGAGLLRDPVVLSCALSCQVQRTSLGKLMKLRLIFSIYRSHNAGVEGSSPSLSTNQIRHFRLPLRSHDCERGTFAGFQLAHLLRGLNQRPDFRGRIVRRDMIRLVAQEELAILETHADGSKPMSIRVFEIVNPNGPKSSRARSSKLVRIALRRATDGFDRKGEVKC
jgi:hypothetical protein